jgi:hypothetical protein
LSLDKKHHLLTMFNSTEPFDHLFVGLTGAAIAKAIAHYYSLNSTAQTLLSLAGFGIGNIIYNALHENKFTDYDQETRTARIKL